MSNQVDSVIAELGIHNLKFTYDPAEAESLAASPECTVGLADAARAAIGAFLNDARGTGVGDSPLALVLATPEQHSLPAEPSAEEASSRLRQYLGSDPAAELVLLTASTVGVEKYRFTPEQGESLDENWVFRIILPSTFDILNWSIVDKTGGKAAYCYGVE
jgi:hypothetical protein